MMHSDPPRPITMTVQPGDGRVIITVLGQSPTPSAVRYDLEVTGASTTRHSGRTMIHGGPRILSQVSVATTAPGCATLTVSEEGRASYSIRMCFQREQRFRGVSSSSNSARPGR